MICCLLYLCLLITGCLGCCATCAFDSVAGFFDFLCLLGVEVVCCLGCCGVYLVVGLCFVCFALLVLVYLLCLCLRWFLVGCLLLMVCCFGLFG